MGWWHHWDLWKVLISHGKGLVMLLGLVVCGKCREVVVKSVVKWLLLLVVLLL